MHQIRRGAKVRSLKKKPDIYFLVGIADKVRGRGRAKVIDDPEYAIKVTLSQKRE